MRRFHAMAAAAVLVGLCVSRQAGAYVEPPSKVFIGTGKAETWAGCSHQYNRVDLSGPLAYHQTETSSQSLSLHLNSTGGGDIDYGTQAAPKVVNTYAYADLYAQARIGSLHAFAVSQTRVTKQFEGVVYDGSPIKSSGAMAVNDISLGYTDQVVITSDTIPQGQWVSLKFSFDLDSTVGVSGSWQVQESRVTSWLKLATDGIDGYSQIGYGYMLADKADKDGVVYNAGPLERTISVRVGDTLLIDQTLMVYTKATQLFGKTDAEALADVLHTATLQLVPEDASVQMISASGHDYTTVGSVPEPGTLTLLGGAVLLLRRRQRLVVKAAA